MIGEWLYALAPKELLSQPVIQRAAHFRRTSSAAASITHNYTVPADHVLWLQHGYIVSIAGAGQTVDTINLEIRDAQNNVITELARTITLGLDAGGVGEVNVNLLTTPVLVMPSEQVRFASVYNAAVAANALESSLIGLLLPKGTLQFGSLVES